jgi:hypothetical protein
MQTIYRIVFGGYVGKETCEIHVPGSVITLTEKSELNQIKKWIRKAERDLEQVKENGFISVNPNYVNDYVAFELEEHGIL